MQVFPSVTSQGSHPWHGHVQGRGPYVHSPCAIPAEKREYVFTWICCLGPQFAWV